MVKVATASIVPSKNSITELAAEAHSPILLTKLVLTGNKILEVVEIGNVLAILFILNYSTISNKGIETEAGGSSTRPYPLGNRELGLIWNNRSHNSTNGGIAMSHPSNSVIDFDNLNDFSVSTEIFLSAIAILGINLFSA